MIITVVKYFVFEDFTISWNRHQKDLKLYMHKGPVSLRWWRCHSNFNKPLIHESLSFVLNSETSIIRRLLRLVTFSCIHYIITGETLRHIHWIDKKSNKPCSLFGRNKRLLKPKISHTLRVYFLKTLFIV